jgi:hypothetical protein
MAEDVSRVSNIDKKSRLTLLLVLFIPCCFVLFRALDNDIWFLLNHGRYVLENGIPHIEPFTIHQDFHFVMQQWLSAVMFWLAYSSFGAFGVQFVVMLCFGILIIIIYKLCIMVSNDNFLISFTISFFVSIVFVLFMVSRPFALTAPLLAFELYLLERYVLTNKRKYIFFLPVISVLLINLQAAMWPMLLILTLPYIVESFDFKIGSFTNKGFNKRWLFVSVFLSLLAGLLNPYGFEAMLYLFNSYGYEQINSGVSEMNPVNINTGLGKIAIFCIAIVPVVYCSYKKGKIKLRYILLTLGTAYMTMSSYRNLYLFAICSYFPLAAYLRDIQPPSKKSEDKGSMRFRKILIVLIVALLPFAFLATYESSKQERREIELLNNTIDYILAKEEAGDVVLYTGYNEGNVAQFRGIKTYMDARAEVFVKRNNKKEEVFQEYSSLQRGKLYYKDILNKYEFSHLLITNSDLLFTYLPKDSDYAMVYSNEKYMLYEKTG